MLWAGVFAFGMQIYADFSAYSDIARGVARWFGFELVRQLQPPLHRAQPHRLLAALAHLAVDAGSATTSTSRSAATAAGALQREANLMATFLVSGLWHGASWNYVLWGLYHGTLVVVTRSIGTAAEAARELARSAGHRPDSR